MVTIIGLIILAVLGYALLAEKRDKAKQEKKKQELLKRAEDRKAEKLRETIRDKSAQVTKWPPVEIKTETYDGPVYASVEKEKARLAPAPKRAEQLQTIAETSGKKPEQPKPEADGPVYASDEAKIVSDDILMDIKAEYHVTADSWLKDQMKDWSVVPKEVTLLRHISHSLEYGGWDISVIDVVRAKDRTVYLREVDAECSEEGNGRPITEIYERFYAMPESNIEAVTSESWGNYDRHPIWIHWYSEEMVMPESVIIRYCDRFGLDAPYVKKHGLTFKSAPKKTSAEKKEEHPQSEPAASVKKETYDGPVYASMEKEKARLAPPPKGTEEKKNSVQPQPKLATSAKIETYDGPFYTSMEKEEQRLNQPAKQGTSWTKIDHFSFFEIRYINSEENQTENQTEIDAFKHYLDEMRAELAAKHKIKLENMIQIGTLQPGPETVGIFPFEKQWYLYQRESRYDDVEVYGPYSTEDAVLLSIQTAYFMEDYGIPYIKVPANMQFRK